MSGDLKAAQRELDGKVLGRPGVNGTAIGEHRGRPCLKVYVSDAKARASLPSEVRGIPVVAEKSGPFRKL